MTSELLKTYAELLLFAFFSALVVSYLITPVIIRIGFSLGFIDEPDERRIHESATPRCGGLGVFVSFAISLILITWGVPFAQMDTQAVYWVERALPVAGFVVIIGLIDDRWEIRPCFKLLGQVIAGFLAWHYGFHLDSLVGIEMLPFVDMVTSVFLFVAAMNAYNLIDGMDGVAGGLGAITSLGLCGLNIIQGNEAMAAICLALTGSCLGFLRYNFHPARIFLGDTGSMLIGFLLMAITLGARSRSAALVMLVVPLLTMGVPLIDTGLAIWRRSVRKAINPGQGGKVSCADKDHLHHRFARKGLTQRKVAAMLYTIQATVFIVGLAWVFMQSYRIAIFTVAFFVGSYVVLRYLASLEMTDSGRWIVDGIRRPGRMQLYSSLMPFMDITLLSLALVGFSWLFAYQYPDLTLNRLIRETAAPFIGGPIILIWATRYYRPQWTRARALDYFYVGGIATVGVLVGLAISPLPLHHTIKEISVFALVMFALTIPPMIFLRVFPRLVQDMVHYHERRKKTQTETNSKRVLIYGAGYGYTLITRAESFDDSKRRKPYFLVGLIDDDPYLRGRMVHGHPVLGSLNDLENLVEEREIEEVLLSTELHEENLQRLMHISETHNLRVRQSLFSHHILRDITEQGSTSPLK
jgi:UDP-N-acetylmuramyl pentapeptide phosphotransferase/UDP-N-acetylglucosamine-1-phosphate transferase